jgi:hypothetical protein
MGLPVTASRIGRYAITIPANTGNGATILSLLQAAGFSEVTRLAPGNAAFPHGLKIAARTIDGAQRGALQVASPRYDQTGTAVALTSTDFTTHGQFIPIGEEYYEPVDGDFYSSVRSNTASAIPAMAVVYII